MDVREVLVSVECDDGRGGVVRGDDGQVWLSRSVDRVGGPRVDSYRPAHLGLRGDRTLLGGLLAPGAVSAEAVDDRGYRVQAAVGYGAWAVVLEQPRHGPVAAVCLRDARGRPVAPALPASWTRAPVTDTDEPCPACGAVAWDEVLPSDGSRGGRLMPDGETEPTPVVVCRTCGHEEEIGSVIRFERPEDEDPAEVAERMRAWEASHRAEQLELLAMVSFPIYAAAGWPARLTGHGGSTAGLDGPLTRVERVTVSHGSFGPDTAPELQIETAIVERRHPSEASLAREALQCWLYDSFDASLPQCDAAFVLRMRGRERERRKLAANAEVTERLIEVDGTRQPFRFVASTGRWAAVRRTDTLTITVTGHAADPDKLTLMAVADPPGELLGAEPCFDRRSSGDPLQRSAGTERSHH